MLWRVLLVVITLASLKRPPVGLTLERDGRALDTQLRAVGSTKRIVNEIDK